MPAPQFPSPAVTWSTRIMRARRRAAGVTGIVAVTLVVSSYPFVEKAAAAPTPEPTPVPAPALTQAGLEPTGTGLVRPDEVSARVTARASGQRVEVLSKRSEFARTWALPEGGFEAESAGSPVRFPDPADPGDPAKWRDVDTTLLANADGTVSPKAVPLPIVLGGQGDAADELVNAGTGGRAPGFGAGVDDTLPAPVLDGSTATYSDVLPGVDVKVEVRSTGFEQLWVAKDQAGLDALLSKQAVGDLGVSAAVDTDKLTATPQIDGSVTLADASKKVVSRVAAPTVWDAEIAPDGSPANEVPADLTVVKAGAVVPDKKAVVGDLDLSVTLDQDWLDDPTRQFPITIDPTYVVGAEARPIFDTYVKDTATTDRSDSTYLPVGYGSDGLKNRSFLNFDTTPFVGKVISSAKLSLWGDDVGSCTPSKWSAYDSAAASTASRWTSQPTIGTKYASSSETKGASGCAAEWVGIDMKAQLQAWADGTATTQGMALKADNETSNSGYHRFWSSDATSNLPVLRWSYDRAPAKMAYPNVADSVMYQPADASSPILYTADTKPNVSGIVSDPDGDTVRAKFYLDSAPGSGLLAGCTNGSFVASGTTTSCELDTALGADSRGYLRARSVDTLGYYGPFSDTVEVRIAANTPAAPSISCPAPYTSNAWNSTAPSSDLDCTVTATGTGYSAPSTIRYSVDNAKTFTDAPITQSSFAGTANTKVSIPKAAGGHNIRAYAVSPTGKQSPLASYATGWGAPSLLAPADDPRVTATDTVTVLAAGPPRGTFPLPTAKVQWRVAGADDDTTGWVDAPAGNGLTVAESGGQSQAGGVFRTAGLAGLADGAGITVNGRVPTLIDTRVCLTYSSGPQCTPGSSVLKVPHAFGAGFPIGDAGPGQVALWTGELQIDDSDADLTTPTGSLSVSRTHSSFAGTSSAANGVFGPGWTASFDGDGSGASGSALIDGTTLDATLALQDSDGSVLVWTTPNAKRRVNSTALPAGTYKPASEDTKGSGAKLVVLGTNAAPVVEVTGDDGTITKFAPTTTPGTGPITFKTLEVREPATALKTTYIYDAAGRVTAIVAALPDGVTTCTAGTATAGCRVLKISYASDSTAVPASTGDYPGRIKQISAQVNTDADKVLASYVYDNAGRLVTATDTRTGLVTSYGWTGTGTGLRLATLTPPGQAAYTFAYANDRLTSVTRPNPASAGGGTAQLAAYVYDVPVAGTVAELPDMSAEVAKWNQASAPTTAVATFGQDKAISAAPAAGSPDWQYADLQLMDPNGYTVNTAAYGAGDWQLTAADYDSHDNVVRAWDERATRALRNNQVGPGAAAQYATVIVYNEDFTIGGVLTQAGTRVTDTYTPLHPVAGKGSTATDQAKLLRLHTHTDYDQGAPNSGINPDTGLPYGLPTKTTVKAETGDGQIDETVSTTWTGYDALASGDTTGWALGQATSSTTDLDGSGTINTGDITSKTRYDSRGRTIETRQPKSSGSDAGTKITAYYTAASTGTSGCTSKPAWAGTTCQTGPAAQPSGQTVPTTKTTGYTWNLQPTTSVDTSGAVTSTTTTTYNAQDRPTTVATSVSGLTGSTALPTVTTSYDTATGNTTGTSSSAGSTAMTYDSWGRQLTYTNTPAGQPADTGTTTYDTNGRVTTVADGNGQTAYTYDGMDAVGKAERRGLTTAVKVKIAGGTVYTSTGAYDDAGDLTVEQLPGNLTRRTAIDLAGEQTALTINGQVTNDAGQAIADQPWIGWTTTNNAQSQVVREYASDNITSDAESARAYTYDRAGRLTRTDDATGTPDANGVVPCTTRTYAFDANGNRTSQKAIPAANGGSCTTTGGTTTTRAYDSADRPTTGGNASGSYVYDQLGRQTSIPAVDTPNLGRGDLTLTYYDDDTIRTTNQGTLGSGGTKTTHTLDAANRRLVQTNQTDAGTTIITRHYTDGADNPTWTAQTTGTTTTTTRYNELVDGDLGLTLSVTGGTTIAELDLSTPRDDIAATVSLTPNVSAPSGTEPSYGIDNWNTYNEYGIPQQPVATTNTGAATRLGYGWLGAKQRATNPDDGLTFMGVRLYNAVTGLFTSTDPVPGGNTTAYTYPQDPIGQSDLSGEAKESKSNKVKRQAYTAAVCRSLGRLGCVKAGYISRLAIKIARAYSGNSNLRNAMQHYIWMGLLSRTFGRRAASSIGAAHEYGLKNFSDTRKDSYRDTANNGFSLWDVSRTWGSGYNRKNSYAKIRAMGQELRQRGRRLYNQGYFARVR